VATSMLCIYGRRQKMNCYFAKVIGNSSSSDLAPKQVMASSKLPEIAYGFDASVPASFQEILRNFGS